MRRSFTNLLLTTLLVSLLAGCAGGPAAPAATLAPTITIPEVEENPAKETVPEIANTPEVPVTASTPEAEAAQPEPTQTTTAALTPTETAANQPEVNAAGTRTFTIDPQASEASYEVQEQFLNRSLPNKAIGRTTQIEGELLVNLDGAPMAEIPRMVVDLRGLSSDSSRRDERIRGEWLESNTYPLAEFVSTGIQGAPQTYIEGQEVTFQLLGDLTIREVTRPVTFDVVAKLERDTVTGTAVTHLLMRDFGFDPPVVAGILTVEDGVQVTVNFTAREN